MIFTLIMLKLFYTFYSTVLYYLYLKCDLKQLQRVDMKQMEKKMQSEFISLENTPKSAKSYWSVLRHLMSLKDGINYEKDHVFHSDELLQLTPTDICEFFCLKVYGTTTPGPDAKPQFGRSTSLESYKKKY